VDSFPFDGHPDAVGALAVVFVVFVFCAIVGENQRFQIPTFATDEFASTSRDRTGQPDAADVDVGRGGVMVSSMLDAMLLSIGEGILRKIILYTWK
jgi:hypothetical protein